MKKIVTVLCLLLSCFVFAQQQHEPQSWFKMYSDYVNVIYKKGQEQEAIKISNTINYIQKNNKGSMGLYDSIPVDVVLRSKTVESNGFVTVSPFRSEFFNVAPTTFSSLGTTDWISTLAIHEYRHVQQFLNHKAGATKVLYYLFGESGWGLGSVLAVPNWYFEGDAVIMETALTQSGRGRLPKFTALQRALYKDKRYYSYQKIRNGSFTDLVPNHYVTGYQMLNYFRNHYNAAKLDNIAKKAASFQFPFYPFSYQLKKETGLSTTDLYEKSAEENSKIWKNQRNQLNVLEYPSITKNTKKVSLYNFPQLMENGQFVALKNELDAVERFVSIFNDGTESVVTNNVINIDPYFQYQNQQLLFTGVSYHPRYNYSSYNDIFVYDLKHKKRKKITHKKRYFSPHFNADNSLIAAIKTNEGNYELVILDTQGNELTAFALSGVLSRPKFVNNSTVVYLKQEHHKLAIFKFNLKNQQETALTVWTSHIMDDLFATTNHVYFSASFDGIDNIYRVSTHGNQQIEQLTKATIGAYQPFVKKQQLYFIETIATGTKISTTPIATPDTLQITEPTVMDFNNKKTVSFENGSILEKVSNKMYPSKKYTSSFQDLKFHDWFYTISEEKVGATVNATTLLNDISLTAGTDIFLNENNSYELKFAAAYQKWWPELSVSAEYQHREFEGSLQDANNTSFDGVYEFHSINIAPSIGLPLSQINGNYNNQAYLGLAYELNSRTGTTFTEENTGEKLDLESIDLNFYKIQFAASSLRRKSKQNINTRAGFSTSIRYNQGFQNSLKAFNNFYFSTINRLYVPGISRSHNAYISFAYQKNGIQQEDTFRYARGFKTSLAKEAYLTSFNYQMPLLYPDFGLWGITYFKRIRANLFADISTLNLNNFKTHQNAVGLEIIFDNTFLNIPEALIGIGFRSSFLLTNDYQTLDKPVVGSFFLSTTLF
ncbi:TolB-like translocation protein [Ochrovirga pacifica]|uniref:hypothetical protein n=1 Tax=Ochrovirga pacifica TaxID=1042376 RepID=UPI000255A7A3|nr:hypothetical protein [Ochrovirga pacifica]